MAKVVYIVSDIDKAVFFEHTAIGLRESGIDLSFILINGDKSELAAFLRSHGFKTHFIKVGKLLFSWRQIIACTRILRAEKPQAVHCHLSAANFIGLVSSFLAGVKVRIYTRHAGRPLALSMKEGLLNHIQNRLSTRIVAITDNTRELLLSEGVPAGKITIVHHGFDIQRMMQPDAGEVSRIRHQYNPRGQYPVVGVVARWMRWKGVHYIIPAFARLLQDHPDARLCLFNASDEADYSREIADMLHTLPPDSYQAVKTFEENIYDLFHLFDIYVHVPVDPWCEAFGQTYVEAVAQGVPSIFTLSGIAREFITDDNAYIVDFRDSDQIYEKMKAILAKQKDPDVLIKNGQAVVLQMFTLDRYITTLVSIYG